MGRIYKAEVAGRWVYPKRRGYRLACCDCGLVHIVNFKLRRDRIGRGKILMQFYRDMRATAAMRRAKNVLPFGRGNGAGDRAARAIALVRRFVIYPHIGSLSFQSVEPVEVGCCDCEKARADARAFLREIDGGTPEEKS